MRSTLGAFWAMNPQQQVPPQKALETWAHIVRTNAENEAIRGLLRCMRVVSPATDAFSTWLLVAVGAATTLFVSNFGSLSPYFSTVRFKWVLMLLAGSVTVGFIQKFLAFLAGIQAQASDAGEALMKEVLAQYKPTEAQVEQLSQQLEHTVDTNLRFERVLDEIQACLPWLPRQRFMKIRKKLLSIPYFAESRAIRTGFAQSLCLFAQMLFTVSALICLALSLK